MSYENIDDNGRTVKCRKKHRCEWCGEFISKGETAVVRVYKFDDVFNDARMHPECWNALQRAFHNSELGYDNSFDCGDAMRGKTMRESESTQKEGGK